MGAESIALEEVESSEATRDVVIAGGHAAACLWWCSTRGSADCAAHHCTHRGGWANGHASAGAHGHSHY
jgi:hypothetical protein